MISLVRTQVGTIHLNQTISISKETTTDELQPAIAKISDVLQFEELKLDELTRKKILNGQTINIQHDNGNFSLVQDDDVVAIVKIENNKAKMSIFLD